jgi:hypothetical protein
MSGALLPRLPSTAPVPRHVAPQAHPTDVAHTTTESAVLIHVFLLDVRVDRVEILIDIEKTYKYQIQKPPFYFYNLI